MRRLLLPALLSIALLACNADTWTTAHFGTYEHASISGVALGDSGAPLDSVVVSFHVPPGRGAYNGGALPPRTATDGRFTVSINRVGHGPDYTALSPDTLTVQLIGSYLAVSGNDPLPQDTAYVLVRFVLREEQAPVSSVTLHIDVPH